jgi:hypothetical protein
MTLRFVDEVPPGTTGPYVRYSLEPIEEAQARYIDIAQVMNTHQAKWLDSLEAWHSDLSQSAAKLTPRWWWSSASRLTAWYPANFKPLFFALGVLQAARDLDGELIIAGAPEETREYLLEAQSGDESGVATAMRTAPPPNPWRLALSLAARILAGKARGGPKPQRSDVLAFSYTLRGDIFAQQDDHYFGSSLDHIDIPVRWLYYLDTLGDRGQVELKLSTQNRSFDFFTDFLSLRDIPAIFKEAAAVITALRPLREEVRPLQIDTFKSHAFARRFIRDFVLAYPPYLEAAIHRGATRALESSGARTLLFPYEEKGIERALIDAARRVHPPVRTVGFAHAVYNDGHLYLKNRSGSSAPPRPDAIASTGPAAARWHATYNGTAPIVIGSPRHVPAARPPQRTGALKILFTVGYGYELERLAAWCENKSGLFADCELLIRQYPYGWSDSQDRGAQRLKVAVSTARVEVGNLETQIQWCDAVLFASTSAGIHAMLRGRPGIQAALHDTFVANPLAGKTEAVESCKDATELSLALARLRALTPEEFASAATAARTTAETIYAPLDTAAWRRTLLGGSA